jgi:hypothetical protein
MTQGGKTWRPVGCSFQFEQAYPLRVAISDEQRGGADECYLSHGFEHASAPEKEMS